MRKESGIPLEVTMKKFIMNQPYEKEVLDKLHQAHLEILKDFAEVCERHQLPYFAIYGTAIGAVRHQGFIPWDDDTDVGMLREDYDKFLKIADREMQKKYRVMTPERDSRYACTVTHLQRKGTVFIAQFSKGLKCEMCIDLDIFPFDYVAPSKKERARQQKWTVLLGRMLFLCGTPYPVIPLTGFRKSAAEAICFTAHYALKLFRISPKKIYRKFTEISTKYNDQKTRYVTSFEYAGSIKDMIPVKDLFPLKEVPFETGKIKIPNNNDAFLKKVYGDYMKIPPKDQQINHCPYMIQFEGEELIKYNTD